MNVRVLKQLRIISKSLMRMRFARQYFDQSQANTAMTPVIQDGCTHAEPERSMMYQYFRISRYKCDC